MNNVLHFKYSSLSSSPRSKYITGRSYTTPKSTPKPQGYWKDKKNQKEFFDQLAVKWNIQKPEDWNKVTNKMVFKEGGRFIGSSLQQGTEMHE
jgi:hypothetical protein